MFFVMDSDASSLNLAYHHLSSLINCKWWFNILVGDYEVMQYLDLELFASKINWRENVRVICIAVLYILHWGGRADARYIGCVYIMQTNNLSFAQLAIYIRNLFTN